MAVKKRLCVFFQGFSKESIGFLDVVFYLPPRYPPPFFRSITQHDCYSSTIEEDAQYSHNPLL